MAEQKYFFYSTKETDHLKKRDAILGQAIDKIGKINRPVIPDPFQSLVKSIVGQQISSQAQTTVWTRLQDRFKPLTAKILAAASPQAIQACGMTMRKAHYINNIAREVKQGNLDFSQFEVMTDQEICQRLTQLDGVGTWTAEMFLIFAMQRPDVISYKDLAILRGMRMLYGYTEITAPLCKAYRKLYSPYASVAGLYLWAIAGGALPELVDPLALK